MTKEKSTNKEFSKNEKLIFSTVFNLSQLLDLLTVDMMPEIRNAKIVRLQAAIGNDLREVSRRMGIKKEKDHGNRQSGKPLPSRGKILQE